MFYYSITTGDIYSGKIKIRPRTCFVMTQLGKPPPSSVTKIRRTLGKCLSEVNFHSLDAGYEVTGKDFLNKIWDIILSVPLGIGIITNEMDENAIVNVFYEIGLMQALGKETLVIKDSGANVPTDLVRTEYIEYSRGFTSKFRKYTDKLWELADYCAEVADQLSNNPMLAIDYVARAYLITGEDIYKDKIRQIALNSISESNPIIRAITDTIN